MTCRSIVTYTVKQIRVKDLNGVMLRFIADTADYLNRKHSNRYDWATGFALKHVIENHLVIVCFKDDCPVGILTASVQPSFFDIKKTVLRQEVLFSKYPKATHELIRYFIDFGRLRANYIIATIGGHTNLKPASLERLGFTKVEELFLLEV